MTLTKEEEKQPLRDKHKVTTQNRPKAVKTGKAHLTRDSESLTLLRLFVAILTRMDTRVAASGMPGTAELLASERHASSTASPTCMLLTADFEEDLLESRRCLLDPANAFLHMPERSSEYQERGGGGGGARVHRRERGAVRVKIQCSMLVESRCLLDPASAFVHTPERSSEHQGRAGNGGGIHWGEGGGLQIPRSMLHIVG